ncbi:MAG TPA: hypothetical protein VI056_11420 [Candidatus Limnocylindria bacterium]
MRGAPKEASYDAEHMRPMRRADGDSLTPRPADIPIILRILPTGERMEFNLPRAPVIT